ncbi:MAG: hypothetical protein HIU57_07385 [Acidobacteria bacterium]|nr:hypothetical protein [Acidobacteriota bacterium]
MVTKLTSSWRLGVMATVLLGAPPVAAATSYSTAHTVAKPQVIVSAFSEKGDAIDKGVSSVYSSRWSTLDVTTSEVYLVAATTSGAVAATFRFDPVAGQTLKVGNYDNLQRATSRIAGFAGIDITGAGRPTGCTHLTGSYRIWDLAADARGTITRLDLTYVERCDAARPAAFGEVLINDAPRVGALIASAARIAFPDQSPTLPYDLTNPTSRAHGVSLRSPGATVSHFKLTPATASCARSVPARATCTYLVRLVPPKPGLYQTDFLVSSSGVTRRLALSGRAGGV